MSCTKMVRLLALLCEYRPCTLFGDLFYSYLTNVDEDFPERASGNEMDEQRKQQMAYQYLCHLEEAKTWVYTCTLCSNALRNSRRMLASEGELTTSDCEFRWIEACLKDELPPTTEIEEALRTGVILARVGNYFASEVVPLRKIYDRELKRFQVSFFRRNYHRDFSLSQTVWLLWANQ